MINVEFILLFEDLKFVFDFDEIFFFNCFLKWFLFKLVIVIIGNEISISWIGFLVKRLCIIIIGDLECL